MSQSSGVESRRTVLAVVSGGNFTQLGARFLLSPVVPFVIADLDASESTVGLALTLMWATYALFQFPSGVLADRFGERRLLFVGLGGAALGTTLVALAPSLPVYALFTVVLGAGAGLFFSPASSLLSRLFDDAGGALGALTAGGALAGVVYPAVGGFLGETFGWRVAVAAGTLVTLPVLAASVALLPRVPPANPDRSLRAAVDLEQLRTLVTRPSVAYTTVVAIAVSFTFQAFSSLFPTFLVQHRTGIDPTAAGLVFGGVFGLSSLAQPVAGRLSDRISRDFAIAASVTLTAAGLSVLLLAPGRPALFVGAGVLGVGISWPGPVQARFMDQLSAEERGYGFGLVRTVYMFAAAPGSVVVGTLAERAGWVVAFGSVVVVLLACLVVLAANALLSLDL
ncbi:MFS transporter [Halobaculum sp. MBLA0143]|uniref:MFS transporter n=1 Tax=Halobaculum sp. MBLA0143 TaxID=3079933 RepID=UPI0035246FFD